MKQNLILQKASHYLIFAAASGTLLVTPWINLDPINLGKFFMVSVLVCISFGIVLPEVKDLNWKRFRIPLSIALVFLVTMLVSNLMSESPLNQKFFGTYGRNTGVLTYLIFVLCMAVTLFLANEAFAKQVLKWLVICACVNSLYAIVQILNWDPVDWVNPFNPIVGTLGNPNFVSAFLGMASVATVSRALDSSTNIKARMFLGLLAIGFLSIAWQSDSIQGVIVGLAGISIVLLFYIRCNKKFSKLQIPYSIFILIVGVLSFFGTLQKGPFSRLLYQDSITFRGDYWRAALEIVNEYPFIGIGMDSFGDFYPQFRTLQAVERRGPGVTSNTAHNVFLDLTIGGGIFLGLAFFALIILTTIYCIRTFFSSTSFSGVTAGLTGTWIAFLLQSIISINQIGVAIWGWILFGLIIGLNSRDTISGPVISPHTKVKSVIPAKNFLFGALAFFIGLSVSSGPLIHDVRVRSLLEGGNVQELVVYMEKNNVDNFYTIQAAIFLEKNSLKTEALRLYRLASERNMRDTDAWNGVARLSLSAEQSNAIEILRILDPNNEELQTVP